MIEITTLLVFLLPKNIDKISKKRIDKIEKLVSKKFYKKFQKSIDK